MPRLADLADAATRLGRNRAFASGRDFVRQHEALQKGFWRGLRRGGIAQVHLFGKVRREAPALAFGNLHFLDWGATSKALAYVFGKVLRTVPDGHLAIIELRSPFPADLPGQALENTAFQIPCFGPV